MRTHITLWLAAISVSSAIQLSPSDLLPSYHFTRTEDKMTNPNGLMWMPNPDVGPFPTQTYHMFYQIQDPDGVWSWGHATSADMVVWKNQSRTNIRGKSGGGLALPNGTSAHPDWRGVAFASDPALSTDSDVVGTSLWYSVDNDLNAWSVYKGYTGECHGTMGNATAVICPGMVPSTTRAAFIGDNYAWKEVCKYGYNDRMYSKRRFC
jgi:hypothetical protein